MKKILHISCSPRGLTAESHVLSRKIVDHLLAQEPTAVVVDRMLGDGAIAHIDADYARSQGSLADVSEKGTMASSEAFIRELESAEILVLGTPMHNLSVPSTLKAWIDQVVRARRTFNVGPEGKTGMLPDRPVFIAIASGGTFSGERARQPDFLTPYLRAVLSTIGLRDLTFFSVQGTGARPEAVAERQAETDRELQAYFSSFRL
jgi:FMN-dependent NADH-azoreductase